jgi:hypothetical protein
VDCLDFTDEAAEDGDGSAFNVPRCPSLSAMRLIMDVGAKMYKKIVLKMDGSVVDTQVGGEVI